jgi:hypothetical protein
LPDDNRETIGVKATATSKLAATNSVSMMLCVVGDENGEICAVEATPQIPGQRAFGGGEQEPPAQLRVVQS